MTSQFNLPSVPVASAIDITVAAGEVLTFIRRYQTDKGEVASAILETAKATLVPYKGGWGG